MAGGHVGNGGTLTGFWGSWARAGARIPASATGRTSAVTNPDRCWRKRVAGGRMRQGMEGPVEEVVEGAVVVVGAVAGAWRVMTSMRAPLAEGGNPAR